MAAGLGGAASAAGTVNAAKTAGVASPAAGHEPGISASERRKGLLIAISCYLIWGAFPFYWKLLDGVNPFEILLHRVLWSLVFAASITILKGELREFWTLVKSMWKDRTPFLKMTGAGLLIMLNWGAYIYCVSTGRLLDAALAYFINPIISILLGFLILKERLTRLEIMAIIISLSGVLVILIYNGELPLLSLTMAFSFAFYGLIKKNIVLKPLHSLFFENTVLMPIVISALCYLHFKGIGNYNLNATGLFLSLGGVVTAVPLLLFAIALKKIDLSTMGFTQFLNPTIVFLLGIFVYHEPLNQAYLSAFILIWLGIGLYIYSRFIKGPGRTVEQK